MTDKMGVSVDRESSPMVKIPWTLTGVWFYASLSNPTSI